MRSFIFILVTLTLIVVSCNKENHNYEIYDYVDEVNVRNIQFANVENLTSTSNLNVHFKVFKDDLDQVGADGALELNWSTMKAIGSMLIDDSLTHNFIVTIDTGYLNQIQYLISPIDSSQITFYNLFEEDTVIVNLNEGEFSGIINKNELTIGFDCSSNAGNQIIETRALPIIGYWIIAGTVSVVTTVGTCAYERSAARQACQAVYQQCNSNCIRPCDYHYSSGLCGGECNVFCPSPN